MLYSAANGLLLVVSVGWLRRGGAYCKLNSTFIFGVSAANGLLLVVSVGWLRRGGALCKLKYSSFLAFLVQY